jgi:GNAT superfamily N-acetyltransferase
VTTTNYTTTDAAAVRAATPGDNQSISTVLARAFADDPVFTWCIPDAGRRRATLPDFFAQFAQAYQPLAASRVVNRFGTSDTEGAALWAPPGRQAVADEHGEEFVDRIAAVVGSDAGRVFAAVALLEQHHPHTPCYYLNFLGVDPNRHGAGLGSALLSDTLRRCDEESQPAYLEATSPRNQRLYQRHGFATTGEIVLPDGPSLWTMWREPRATRSR